MIFGCGWCQDFGETGLLQNCAAISTNPMLYRYPHTLSIFAQNETAGYRSIDDIRQTDALSITAREPYVGKRQCMLHIRHRNRQRAPFHL
jgi:hypothetical protein